ncbi:MAG: substrate-binding domain-containing protein [Armatimonadota bacterium]
MPTIRQLAQLAGVSPAAVSLALRDQPGVSAATRQRIKELAATYHYRIPPTNRVNHPTRYETVGYISTSIHSQMHSRVLAGVLDLAFTESVRVVPLQLHAGDVRDICLAIEVLAEQGVEGLLLYSNHADALPAQILFELASRDIAVVCIDIAPAAYPLDRVSVDGERVGELAIDHLFTLGHRDIAIIRYAPDDSHICAMVKYARQYGMAARCILLDVPEALPGLLTDTYHHQPLPTAFVCHNDYCATYALHFALHRGLQVPRDISIVGCGNYLLAGYSEPPLTTIDYHPHEIGQRALAGILQRIHERKSIGQYTAQTVVIEPELILRQSCAPPRHLLPPARRLANAPAAPSPRTITPRKGRVSTITWRAEDTEEALAQRFHTETAPDLRKRWQALLLLRQGYQRLEIVQMVGVHPRTLREWIAWYRTGGTHAVAAHRLGGFPVTYRRLTDAQCTQLADVVRQGTVQTIRQAQDWVADTCRVRYSYCGMRNLLARLVPDHAIGTRQERQAHAGL